MFHPWRYSELKVGLFILFEMNWFLVGCIEITFSTIMVALVQTIDM